MKRVFKLICFFVISSIQLNATRYFVNDASSTGDLYCTAIGSNANNGLSASSPKLTLQNVLATYSAVFTAGDTIFIDAGNYTDNNLNSPKNGVVILGVYAKSLFTNGGADNYFMEISNNNTVLENLTLSNYNAQTCAINGQVIGVANGVTGVKLLNVIVQKTSVTSTSCGYPIDIGTNASVTLSGGGAVCNNWDAGGGIHVSTSATVTISSYLFYGNFEGNTNGCALSIDGGLVNVRNTTFINNTSDQDTYGSAIYMAGGMVNVYDCYIDSNTTNLSYDAPGGSILVAGGNFHITRSIIKNHIQAGGSTSEGAGISVTGGAAIIDSTVFSNNSGKASYGTDVYNKGGTVLARNCSFNSLAGQIGSNVANSFSITSCGNPSVATGTIKEFDTNPCTYTANPSAPWFSGTCATAIKIIPTCTITPVITSAIPTNTLCSGGTFISNLTSQTAASLTTYSWTSSTVTGISGHANNGSGNIHETLTNTSTGTLVVTYSITPIFNNTCTGTTTVYSVSVYPVSGITVTSATICVGSKAIITPSGASTYTLQPLNVTGTSFTVSPAVTSSYTITGNSSNGCSASNAYATITTNPLPTLSVTASSTNLCIGNTSTLTASGANTYTWSPAAGLNITNVSAVLASPVTATIYSVTGTSLSGCVNTSTVDISVNPIPTLTVNSATACFGVTSTLMASGASSYSWMPAGGLNTTTGATVMANPTSTTVYTVTGTTGTCNSSQTSTVIINPLPSLTVTTGSGIICSGSSSSLTVNGADTYTWSPAATLNSSSGSNACCFYDLYGYRNQ